MNILYADNKVVAIIPEEFDYDPPLWEDFRCKNCGAVVKSGIKKCEYCGTIRKIKKESENWANYLKKQCELGLERIEGLGLPRFEDFYSR